MNRSMVLPADWDALVGQLLAAARGRRLVVLLDGGSGAGKTTLAQELHAGLEHDLGRTQLVSLDDVYPGWGGLAAASDWVWQQILHPTRPGYPRWDWQEHRPAGRQALDPQLPIIVEGCGTLSRASAPLATTSLWYEMSPATRRERALSRDGETFRPHWDAWAAQEAEHWRRNRPWELADVIVRHSGLD